MDLFDGVMVRTTQELLAMGFTSHALTKAVRGGEVLRPRNGLYVAADCDPAVLSALRVGGRCGCITAAARSNIWVASESETHLAMPRSMSRMRHPQSTRRALTQRNRGRCVLHWSPLLAADDASAVCVAVIDALAQIVRCQPREYAVAAIDSALNQRLVTLDEIVRMFDCLPGTYRHLLDDVDGRAESGSETLCRLALKDAGLRVEIQVTCSGVGRIDIVVEGRVTVECDSFAWHGTWDQAEEDRRRDMQLAIRGFRPLRPTAKQVLDERPVVVQAVQGLLAHP